MTKTTGIAMSLALIPLGPVMAQEPELPRDLAARWDRVRMLSDLRALVPAQGLYFADHDTYATSIAELTSLSLYETTEGVTVVIVLASDGGWNAVAVHESVPGLRCAIHVGAAGPPLQNDAAEGEPSCTDVGGVYRAGEGVARNVTRDMALYQRACDEGDATNCSMLGFMYHRDQGVTQDLTRAASFYQQACDLEDESGCHNIALMYEKGWGVTQDLARADSLYRKACDLGMEEDCRRPKRPLLHGADSAPAPWGKSFEHRDAWVQLASGN